MRPSEHVAAKTLPEGPGAEQKDGLRDTSVGRNGGRVGWADLRWKL